MKTALVLIGLLAVFQVSSAKPYPVDHERYLEDIVNATINAYTGFLARFDPINVEHWENKFLLHTAQINNFHAEGFSNIVATHIKIDGLFNFVFEFDVVAPHAVGNVEQWSVEGPLFYGKGAVSTSTDNVKLSVRAEVKLLALKIVNLTVKTSGSSTASITGLYNDEALSQRVTDIVNAIAQDILSIDYQFSGNVLQLVADVIKHINEWIHTIN